MIELLAHRAVELFDHVIKNKARMVADFAPVEDGIDFKYFRKVVQRLNGIVSGGDDEIFTHNKVYFFAGVAVLFVF